MFVFIRSFVFSMFSCFGCICFYNQIYYFLEYAQQPYLYRDGANDGFRMFDCFVSACACVRYRWFCVVFLLNRRGHW